MHTRCRRPAAPTRTGSSPTSTANRPGRRPLATTKSYPARKGFDEFYGYGRVEHGEGGRGAPTPARSRRRPRSPRRSWYAQVDPAQPTVDVARPGVRARPRLHAAGSTSRRARSPTTASRPTSRRATSAGRPRAGATARTHTSAFDGALATLDIAAAQVPLPRRHAGNFNGREPPPGPPELQRPPEHRAVRVHGAGGRDQRRRAATTLTGQDRRNLYLHRDQDMLPGFPKPLAERRRVLAARSPTSTATTATSWSSAPPTAIVHAMRPRRHRAAGLAGAQRPAAAAHRRPRASRAARSTQNASLRRDPRLGRRRRPRPRRLARGDRRRHGAARSTSGTPTARCASSARPNIDYSGKPLQPFVNVRRGHRYRTQHGFIGSPVRRRPRRQRRQPRDRRRRTWTATSTRGTPTARPWTASRCSSIDRSKITAIDPQTARADVQRERRRGAQPGRDRRHARGRRPQRRRQARDRRRDQRGVRDGPGQRRRPQRLEPQRGDRGAARPARRHRLRRRGQPLGGLANATRACSRSSPTASRTAGGRARSCRAGRRRSACISTELLPVVGRGHHRLARDRARSTAPTAAAGRRSGRDRQRAAPAYIFNPDGTVLLRPGGAAQDNALQTDFAAGTRQVRHARDPGRRTPGVRQPRRRRSPSPTPAAGVIRALDLAVNEYQGGQDFVAAWDATTGQFRPGLPAPVNDLQFLTGPSVARPRRPARRGDRRRHRLARPVRASTRPARRSPRLAEADRATGRSRTRWSARSARTTPTRAPARWSSR